MRRGVRILCVYGATEMGNLTTILTGAEERGPEDWEYVRFAGQMDVRMVRQSDGSFESQFLVRVLKITFGFRARFWVRVSCVLTTWKRAFAGYGSAQA